jgi:methyl-accepting chemotaxis protein
MALLMKLSLVQRVQALGAICMAMTVALATNLVNDSWHERSTARQEAVGLGPAAAWIQLAKLTAEHRGLSAGFLGGNEDFRAKRDTKQKDVDAALKQALEAIAGVTSPRNQALLEGQAQEWQALSQAVAARSVSGKESFKRHNALVQRQLDTLDEVVAVSGLSLEPQAATYNLVVSTLQRLPQASEWTGQLRGFGAGMLAKQAFAPQDKAFIALTLTNAQQAIAAVQTQLQRSGQADPAVERVMVPLQAKAQTAWDQAVATIQKAVLDAETPELAGAVYFARLTEAIDAQQALATAAFGLLDRELSARARLTFWQVGVTSVLGVLLAAFNLALAVTMVRSIRRSSSAALRTAAALAQGDFSVQHSAHGHDEFGQIVQALDRARLGISQAIADVRQGVDTIATASEQISQGSTDLSQRTEQQANALQQTAANMEELTGTVSQSSDNARQANQLASAASAAAAEGGEVMARVVGTMDEIAQASTKISNIIGVIDGIAFQTNILALNAAVEAARAGEQGRGFAVVASEVRQLAQRSAAAAREIKSMISASSERVEAGGQLVQTAGRSIHEIVAQVQRMSDLIGEIAAASSEQSKGLAQINEAVNHLDQGTQQNSALAEESAAAAESLREQSERLTQSVGAFRLAEA